MGDYARITPTGDVLIDTAAWIAARTGGVLTDLTDQLHGWARHHRDEAANPATATDRRHAAGPGAGWPGLALAWCEHAGHQVDGTGLVVHHGTRLDTSVWILPATATATATDGNGDSGDGGRIAVVGVGDHPPLVYADATVDPWAWRDADTVTITCPTPGHWWTWRSGRELLTSTSRPATLGMNLDAPFSGCPDCAAFQLGQRAAPCGCDGAPWIVCPVCGRRCRVGPPHP
jgi:hypothetical protein